MVSYPNPLLSLATSVSHTTCGFFADILVIEVEEVEGSGVNVE